MQKLPSTDFNIFRDQMCGRRRAWASLLTALATVCFVSSAYALDPRRTFSQYIRDQWTAENGFPGREVNAFAQTPDGYLWIGTADGLFRFDGLQFLSTQQLNSASQSITGVLGLTTDSKGDLWVRTRGSILRGHDGEFEDVLPDLAPGSFITAMSRSLDGAILLFNLMKGEILQGRDKFTSIASAKAFQTALVISIAQTSDGRIWLGTRSDGLFYLNKGQIVPVTYGLPDLKINALLPMTNGQLLIGTDLGLALWNGFEIKADKVSSFGPVQISALMRDRDGNVWVGTANGVMRLSMPGFASQEKTEQSIGQISAVFEDREGNIWVGGIQGIERLRDGPFVTYSVAEGRAPESNGPIYVDAEERVWFGLGDGSLYQLQQSGTTVFKTGLSNDVLYCITGTRNELWVGRQQHGLTHLVIQKRETVSKTYGMVDGLAQNSVYAVHESRDGTVWAGTLSGGVSKFRDGIFTTYTTANGLASNFVASIEEGNDGTMWFGTRGGLSALSHDHFRTFTVQDGLPSEDVISLLEDSEGTLWIGTAGGLAAFDASRRPGIQGFSGSLREPILGIAEDKSGSVWIATTNHVLDVSRQRLLNGTLGPGDMREYGTADGLHATEGVRRDRSVVADRQGRIWFSLNRGISVIDPEQMRDAPPAISHIESIVSDGKPLALQSPLRIHGPAHRVVFNYNGLSLSAPERIRFRYRLDGFDHDWGEKTAARQAVYTNLGPGLYRFRMTSTNSDGIWSSSEGAFSFAIEPAFWQTWWFRTSCLLSLASLAWMLHSLRVRQVSRQMQARLEERVEERERIARNLHDTLLQGFASASIQLDVANDRLSGDSPAKPLVERVLELMREVSEEGRNAIRSLRSTTRESHSFEQALSRVGEEFARIEQVEFRVIAQGLPRPLRSAIWDEVYRIAREAVINAFRHSHAGKIEVEVEYTSRYLRILVRDDGRGIDADVLESGREGHWGLSGMRERAEQLGARFSVLSRTGNGTEVELFIPGKVAFETVSSYQWPRWCTRFLPAGWHTGSQSTKKGE